MPPPSLSGRPAAAASLVRCPASATDALKELFRQEKQHWTVKGRYSEGEAAKLHAQLRQHGPPPQPANTWPPVLMQCTGAAGEVLRHHLRNRRDRGKTKSESRLSDVLSANPPSALTSHTAGQQCMSRRGGQPGWAAHLRKITRHPAPIEGVPRSFNLTGTCRCSCALRPSHAWQLQLCQAAREALRSPRRALRRAAVSGGRGTVRRCRPAPAELGSSECPVQARVSGRNQRPAVGSQAGPRATPPALSCSSARKP